MSANIETQAISEKVTAVVIRPQSWRRETNSGFTPESTTQIGELIPFAKRLGPDKPQGPQDPDLPPTPPDVPLASGVPKEPAIVRLPFIGSAEPPGVLSLVRRPDGAGLIKALRAKTAAKQQIAS